MSIISVSSWAELKTAVNTTSTSGDTIKLTISFPTSDDDTLDISDLTIDGNGRTITLHSSRTQGLFESSNSTVS